MNVLVGDELRRLQLRWNEEEEFEGGMGSSSSNERGEMHIVYPYGATLSVQRPAAPILSSGVLAIPIHRPLGQSLLEDCVLQFFTPIDVYFTRLAIQESLPRHYQVHLRSFSHTGLSLHLTFCS